MKSKVKSKISVSIDRDVLRLIDSRIDGMYVKNRSQAVELVIRESLSSSLNDAVILAGGCMNTKILSNIMDQVEKLARSGISNIVMVPGENYDAILSRVGAGSELGISIKYLREEKHLGTAGALKLADGMVGNQFLLLYSDMELGLDITKMLEYHGKNNALVTAAVVAVSKKESTDLIAVEGQKMESFEYKPKEKGMINLAGIYVMDSKIFSLLPSKGSLEIDVFPKIVSKEKVLTYNFSGKWRHIV